MLQELKWPTIDTAPRDGTKICVAWFDEYWNRWSFRLDYWRAYRVEGEGWGGFDTPSHWMPLPAPPRALDIDHDQTELNIDGLR